MGFYENSHGVMGDVFSQPFTSDYYTIDDSEFDNTKPGTYTIYLKYGTASASYQVTVSAPNTTTASTATTTTTTTTDVPEQWMYGTGVDHFRSIKTLPTKTIYKEGEELDLSGLVIDAFHQVNRHSNKGNFDTLVTNYIWEVNSIDPKYVIIEALNGETVSADDFSKLKGGNAYTVKFSSGEVKLNIAGEDSKKEMYNADQFSFRVYISPADNTAEFTKIENVEVEKFLNGANGGVKLKGYDLFGIFMDEMLTPGYVMNSDLREGDKVSCVGYINTATDSITLYDLEIVSYAGENGDANGDGKVELADAILIMQSLANPDKYSLDGTDDHHLTERGHFHADLDGNGLTADDALEIQLHLLGKPSLLDN